MDGLSNAAGMLDEFSLMAAMKAEFPISHFVFKQTASHLPHEANSEQTFSVAGKLTDPNMSPDYLGKLASIAINQKVFKPCVPAIQELYYKKYSKYGKLGEDTPVADGGMLGFEGEPSDAGADGNGSDGEENEGGGGSAAGSPGVVVVVADVD